MPLMSLVTEAAVMGLADGPTEVHKVTVARQVLLGYSPAEGRFPSAWLPPRTEAARVRYAEILARDLDGL
jgi:acyl-CoA dehydrogenase